MSTAKKSGLGRGLSALLGDETEDYTDPDKVRSSKTVPVALLHPGKYQPRYVMDEDAIDELARSVQEKGVLQPLLVRRHPDHAEQYEIIAGERRWRAAQKAKLHEVPVIIREFTDTEALEVGLVENLQRQDLSAMEEALGYRRLLDEFHHTQENLAGAVGKSRSHVANTLRLLNLPQGVRDLIDGGKLSAGHARALIPCDDPMALARKVVDQGLSVRQAEQLAKSASIPSPGTRPGPVKDPDIQALERDLSSTLGMRVAISGQADKGSVAIHYSTLDQLDDVLLRLSHGPVRVTDEDG